MQKEKLDEAADHFRRALAIQPHYAAAHANLGLVLGRQGRGDEAMAQFQQAVEIKADFADAHYHLAVALVERGQYNEALQHFRRAVELTPDSAEARNDLAWLLATCPAAALRNGGEAIVHARRAIRLSGDVPSMLDTLAAAYAEAGRFPEALAAAHKALDAAARQNDQALAGVLRARIALYQAGKPFHQTPSDRARRSLKP